MTYALAILASPWLGDGLFVPTWAWNQATMILASGRQIDLRGGEEAWTDPDPEGSVAWVQNGVFHFAVRQHFHKAFDPRGRTVHPRAASFSDEVIHAPDGFGGVISISRNAPIKWQDRSGRTGLFRGGRVKAVQARKGIGLLVATSDSNRVYAALAPRGKQLHQISAPGSWAGSALTADGEALIGTYVAAENEPMQDFHGTTTIYRIQGLRAIPMHQRRGKFVIVDYRATTGEWIFLQSQNHFGDRLVTLDRFGRLTEITGGCGQAYPVGLEFGMVSGWVGPL